MNNLFGNTMRSMKNLFVESGAEFDFDHPAGDTRGDPLFDPIAVEPTGFPGQPSNQEAVLKAMAHAAENYYAQHIAPLVRTVPNLRFKLKQIQIRKTAENMHILAEFENLSPAILNEVSSSVIDSLSCATAIDKSDYYGLNIIPDTELAGQAIVMWANVGQSKIAMHFYFDGDIVKGEALPKPAVTETPQADPAAVAAAFHLKLIEQGGAREIVIPHFPAIVGSTAKADLQVGGQYVSGQHLLLNWDPELRCVYLIDRSTHGTYLKNGRKLSDGERVNLLGDGSFSLTNHVNAPRFEYWNGAAPGQGTQLMPPDQCATASQPGNAKTASTAPKSASSASSGRTAGGSAPDLPTSRTQNAPSQPATPAPSASPSATPEARPLRANPAQSVPASGTQISRAKAAQPTQLTDAAQVKPLAWLQVRNAQGQLETVAITTLPFRIGREFEGEGYPLDESYSKVSRNHLTLLEQRGNGFGVNNESPQRPGVSNLTAGKNGNESKQFLWQAQGLTAGEDGWRVLGSSRLDAESIEVRLLAADSFGAGQS